MTNVDTAMIMAAGLGKRMRPLTTVRPKPLVKVAGKALIDHCFDRLWDAGISNVVVNVHYLADALEAHISSLSYPIDITISDERAQLLETGGGLVHAQNLINADPFYCINSDNIWIDGPRNSLGEMAKLWDGDKMDALLLLVPHSRAHNSASQGDFQLDADGRLKRRKPSYVAPYIYTGIQLISKRLLRDAPTGAFSTNVFWDRAIAEQRLFGIVHEGLWFDVGTPSAIEPTAAVLTGG